MEAKNAFRYIMKKGLPTRTMLLSVRINTRIFTTDHHTLQFEFHLIESNQQTINNQNVQIRKLRSLSSKFGQLKHQISHFAGCNLHLCHHRFDHRQATATSLCCASSSGNRLALFLFAILRRSIQLAVCCKKLQWTLGCLCRRSIRCCQSLCIQLVCILNTPTLSMASNRLECTEKGSMISQ